MSKNNVGGKTKQHSKEKSKTMITGIYMFTNDNNSNEKNCHKTSTK